MFIYEQVHLVDMIFIFIFQQSRLVDMMFIFKQFRLIDMVYFIPTSQFFLFERHISETPIEVISN